MEAFDFIGIKNLPHGICATVSVRLSLQPPRQSYSLMSAQGAYLHA